MIKHNKVGSLIDFKNNSKTLPTTAEQISFYSNAVSAKKKENKCNTKGEKVTEAEVKLVKPKDNNKEKKNISKKKPKKVSAKKRLHQFTPFIKYQTDLDLFSKYGQDIMKTSMKLDKSYILPEDFLGYISHELRLRMVDWMQEVFFAYKSLDSTFYLAVNLMDRYLYAKKGKVFNKDIHLIGICCIFLASKIEDVLPLSLEIMSVNIAHNKFNLNDIIKEEKEIVKALDMDFIRQNAYDFLLIYFNDLNFNTKNVASQYNVEPIISKFKRVCVYLSKVMCYYSEFSCFSASLQAIICVQVAYEIINLDNKIKLNQDQSYFLQKWGNFLKKALNAEDDTITELGKFLIQCFDEINNSKNKEGWNINKAYPLYLSS